MPAPSAKARAKKMPPRVTASMFYKYDACPHWLWFDVYGNQKKKYKTSRFAEMLLEMGVLHEERMLEGLKYTEVGGRSLSARAKATLELMRAGAERIYHGVLETDDMVGEPDILERRDTDRSIFGEYYYVAIDIKSAERLNDAHKLQLSCYADLLAATQEKRPEEAYIINGSGIRVGFSLVEFEPQYREALADLKQTLAGRQPTAHLSSGCKQSPWFGECKAFAEKTDDIALLYNVKKKAVAALREAGVKTVHDAAHVADRIGELSASSKYLKRDLLERIALQAQALISKTHHVRYSIVLPEAPYEIFFDIEGDPLRQVEYLFGFLLRQNGEERYISMLAEKPEQEGDMWSEFLEWLPTLPAEYVVYHYGTYEQARLTMLEARHGNGGMAAALALFRQRMVDLNEIVKESIVFPLYFYGIKDIGRYVGFEREGKIVSGGESVAFYEEWLTKGVRKRLDDIVVYNTEDVVATRFLKDWLAHEAAQPHQEI